MFFSLLAALAMAVAVPSVADTPAPATPATATTPSVDDPETAKKKALWILMMSRRNESEGIPSSAASPAAAAGTPQPPGAASPPSQSFAEAEAERMKEYDRHFPPVGSFKKLVDFQDHCWPQDNCDRFAATGFLQGGYDFVALKKDVENKVLTQDSGAYQGRYESIKGKIRSALDDFKPGPGVTAKAAEEFLQVTNPVATAILTKQELVKYAERNAAISDSSVLYTHLGQVLNGTGPPAKAKEAFDAALQRDPRSEAALSGRAEAKLEMGDYPGAVKDATAALAMDPKDLRALTALKFSEGRVAGASSDGPPGAHGAAGGAGAAAGGAGDSLSPGAAEASALAHSGSEVSAEFSRRSDGLVVDAKHSLSLGDSAAAIESLRKAIELNPRNAQALSLSAMANIRLKNYPEALAAVEAGLKLAPNSAVLLDSKAFILNHMKDYQGALAAADLALSINSKDSMAYFNRAAALSGLHDRMGTIVALRAAAELDPARFEPVLAAALQLPEDADILYLFPGAAPTEAPSDALPPRTSPSPRTLVGGGLACLALLLAGLLLLRRRAPAERPPSLRATVRRSPSVLAGKYEIGRQIGAGGMGVVYEGRDRSLARPVAIKRMREEIRWDPKERDRFVSEAKLVAKLRHPHIVEINAIAEHDGEIYLIFEFVKGRTLHELLTAEKRLPLVRARQLFRGVVSALDYAHGLGVVHRDLKPANIMIDADGRARVMDFGIARLTDEALSRHSRTKTGTIVGTPAYMAPEQELSRARKESDVFSLAVCLYEALTGVRPFGGVGAGMLMNKMNRSYPAATASAPGLSPGIDAVFEKALEPDPDKRYATAGAFLRALESVEASPAA